MSSNKKILFVVEGDAAEKPYIQEYAKNIMGLVSDDFEVSVYGTNVHVLYNEMVVKKNYDSIVSYLSDSGKLTLDEGVRCDDAFNSIYLIFDYDPQDNLFSQDECVNLATFFDDETRKGKLYINYPMFESIYHIKNLDDDSFMKLKYSINKITSEKYKECVLKICCIDEDKRLEKTTLEKLINLNKRKYQMIMNQTDCQWDYCDTISLLNVQQELINSNNISLIWVINTSCLLVLDYNPSLISGCEHES